ncbi:hypothetical protein ThrDRAFT_04773 [Frankia casuarinae]|jgi:acyl-CoA synthetase (AMP-forming)/AMP-acid ligase II|uniref:AMP-dependent synthetase/ligase domain-containing protein n=1 Tax=Frankia casuarinae (strain DSM 45818 / CECT 9043 / HFP020203 / CcI3) TaxID=106370 RepID=Q2J5U1_FRACC|nr:AMP-binding protein [Frankia casuarinae]ABD13351.1 hypothetical protein Francci3_4001 [Frankia casuarinae]EYT89612.1 hypothetical protein ThrDRAFT_04773 [Frankia casuarinae]
MGSLPGAPAAAPFYLGDLLAEAADDNPGMTVTTNHPLNLVDGGRDRREFTVAELAGVVDKTAHRLYAAGVRPADQVAVIMTNGFDVVLAYVFGNPVGA